MIFETVTSAIMGGLALKAYLSKSGATNDSQKINKIFSLTGLNVKDGGQTYTAQLVRKKHYDWGSEYKYRLPLGKSFEDYQAKLNTIQDGLNNRRVRIQLRDLRKLQFGSGLIQSIKTLHQNKLSEKKEVELSFDGMLCIRVYNNSLPKELPFEAGEGWKVPIGITREKNKMMYLNFENIPHFVLGGATRYGKSNLINCIINSLLLSQPKNVRFHLIDLKGGVELCDYENLKQTVGIAYEPEQALEVLQGAYNLMRETQEKLRKAGKKKVQEAGIYERHFIIIDEVGELNPAEAVGKEDKALKVQCQRVMSQISRLGAGLGFRLILATQYPTGDVIPRQCKQNADAKLCFRVQSGTASQVVLDETGAEALPEIRGRAIFLTASGQKIVQTPLINSEVIAQATQPYIEYKKEEKHIEPTQKGKAIEPASRSNLIEFEETGLS
jgi:DNA segregation ATPase FtsK/SpoIIIE, S-DNA-T family